MEYPLWFVRRLFFLRIGKHDAEQVAETLDWGADPNWTTSRGTPGTPAIVRASRGLGVRADLIEVLLKAGANRGAMDSKGCTALDHVRRRLAKFEGKPRRPIRRSPSLSPGGELILHPEEWENIEEMQKRDPELGREFEEQYLEARRKAARPYDARTELEAMLKLLEPGG